MPAPASARFHASRAALELEDVALAHRQEIRTCAVERNAIALFNCSAVSTSASTSAAAPSETSEQSVRLSGPATNGFFSLGVAAELEAEILAQLRIGIADAVLVVLRRDHGERVGLVAPALEIKSRDLAENPGEAALDVGLLAHVGGFQQIFSDLRAGRRGHLLDADHQHDARRLRRDRLQPLVHGGGAGRAGILHPQRALEAQIRRGLQHQRSGKILRREARIEVAEHDLVDVAGLDAGVGQRPVGDPHDQALHRLAVEPAEGRMRPAHDAARHDRLHLPNFGRFPLRFTTSRGWFDQESSMPG